MRCYNGCPDSELQSFIDERAKLLKRIKRIRPEAHVTYHHPDGYQVHEWGKPLSEVHASYTSACKEAINKLYLQEN